MEPLPAPTEQQRKKAVTLLKKNRTRGTASVLKAAGVKGTRGQLRELVERDDDLRAELDLARGRDIEKVKQALWEVASDKNHPAFDRANARVLKAYEPAFRDISRHELTGKDGGPLALLAGRMDFDQLTEAELEALKELALKAAPKELTDGSR